MARRANTGFFKDRFVNWEPAPYGYKGEVPMFKGNQKYQDPKLLSAIDLVQPNPNQAPMKVYWQGDVPTVYGKSGNRLALQEASQGAYNNFMLGARVPVTIPVTEAQPNLPLVGRYGSNNIYKDRSLPIVDDGSMPQDMMQSPGAEFREIDYLISSAPKESAYDPDTLRDVYKRAQGQGLDEIEADISSRMGRQNPTWMNPDYDTFKEEVDLFPIVNKQLSQGQSMVEADILNYGGTQLDSRRQIIPEYLPSVDEKFADSYEYHQKGFLVDRPDANHGMAGAAISYPNTPIYEYRNIARIPTSEAPNYQAMQVNEYGLAVNPYNQYIRPPVSLSEPDINPLVYNDTTFNTKLDAKGRPFTTRRMVEGIDPLAGMPTMASGGRWMGGGLMDTGRKRSDNFSNPLTNDNQAIRTAPGVGFVPMRDAPAPNEITTLLRDEMNPGKSIMQYGADDLYDYQRGNFIPVERSKTARVDADITYGAEIPTTPMGEIANAYLPYTDKDGSRQVIGYDPSLIENRPIGDGISTLDRDLADVKVRVGDEYFPLTPQAASSEYGDEFEDYGYGYRKETDQGMDWWNSDGPSMEQLAAIQAGSKANFDDDIAVAASQIKATPAVYNDPNLYPTGVLEAIQDREAQLNRINAAINNRLTSPTADKFYETIPDGYVTTDDLRNQRNKLAQDINSAQEAYSQLMQLEPTNQMMIRVQPNKRVEDSLKSFGMEIGTDSGGNVIASGSLPFMVNPSRSQYPELPVVGQSNLSNQEIDGLEQMREAASYGYIPKSLSPTRNPYNESLEDMALQKLYQERANNWQATPGKIQRNVNYYQADPEVQEIRSWAPPRFKTNPDPFKGEAAFEDTSVPNFATKQNNVRSQNQQQQPRQKSNYTRSNGTNYIGVDNQLAGQTGDWLRKNGVNFSSVEQGDGTIFIFDDANPEAVGRVQQRFRYQEPVNVAPEPQRADTFSNVSPQENTQNPSAQPQVARQRNPNLNRGITLLSLGAIPFAGSQYEQSQAQQRAAEEAMLSQLYGNPGMNSF